MALAFAVVPGCFWTAAAAQTAKPIRQLVYTFDVSLGTTRTVHNSGIAGGAAPASGTGLSDYSATSQDKGELDVDVLKVQPDDGLVVQVTEKARGTRSTKPTMCVTYGNGVVSCDQSTGGLNQEALSLLQVLGRDFLSGAAIDARNHWTYANKGSDSKDVADYTIQNDNNGILTILYDRNVNVSGAQAFSAVSDGRLTYNRAKTLPMVLTEHTITRQAVGMGQDDRTDMRTTISLLSDSMQHVAVP